MSTTTIYVVDIVLLVILYLLIMFVCGYSVYCVYRLVRSMQMRILLRPTRVVFSHKKEGESTEELRTVVAYQNPFTGDYCVHKSHVGRGFENASLSQDSGLSDEYEPLVSPEQALAQPRPPPPDGVAFSQVPIVKTHTKQKLIDNSLNKTWNWNYKEYQI